MIAEAPSVSSERFTVMPSTTKAGQHQPLVANRQPLQPGWLAERYVADMMSADEIAEKCGWSSQYVRERLRDFGIPLRRPGTHSHLRLTLDQRRLESFLQQGLSVTQISLRTGCSTSGVHNLIRRLGLTIPHTVEEPVDVRADPVVAEATTRTQPDQPAATGSCKPAPPERDRGIQHRSDRETAGRVLRRDSSRMGRGRHHRQPTRMDREHTTTTTDQREATTRPVRRPADEHPAGGRRTEMHAGESPGRPQASRLHHRLPVAGDTAVASGRTHDVRPVCDPAPGRRHHCPAVRRPHLAGHQESSGTRVCTGHARPCRGDRSCRASTC